jgi:hypothetical protein
VILLERGFDKLLSIKFSGDYINELFEMEVYVFSRAATAKYAYELQKRLKRIVWHSHSRLTSIVH